MRAMKQPREQLVYAFDFAARLGAAGTVASIVSATVTARGLVTAITPLTIGAQAFSGQQVRLRLDGGTDGETYLVSVVVTDAAGQTHELDAEILALDLGFEIPTVTSPYLSAAAFVDRIGLDDAIAITDTTGTGRIEKARLATALADAQAEVDGYLAVKYQTPLGTVPASIAAIVHDLALARLYRSEPPASVAERRDHARQQLRDLAKGLTALPGAEALAAAATNDTPVLISTGDRLFSRTTLAGL